MDGVMVQQFHVLRCFSCHHFQVQQVKKVNKWICKVCGHKQSLQKEFGRGSGSDCRRHVQKLNAMRGAKMEEQESIAWSLCEQEGEELEQEGEEPGAQVSRWNKYLDSHEEAEPKEGQNIGADWQHLHGNTMTDRKRRREEEVQEEQPDLHSPEQPMKILKCSSGTPPTADSVTVTPPTADSVTVTPGVTHPCRHESLCAENNFALLPSSIFESGEDFSWDDDDFLTDQRA